MRIAAIHALLLGSALCFGCSASEAIPPERLDLCAYEQVAGDKFDTLSVARNSLENGEKWTAHTPWNGDFGDAMFSDPRPTWPFTVADGILTITAFKDETGKWRSGLLAAADAKARGWGVRYGYFEARMRMPTGPGTWPAFWLMSLQPAQKLPKIEIDVIEYYGHMTDRYFATTHVWRPDGGEEVSTHDGSTIRVAPGSLEKDFHRFGVRVDQTHITYFLDRVEVWRQATPKELDTPLYPLVNLALGSGYPIDKTPDPSRLEVDYVRVYKPVADAPACAAATSTPTE